MIKNRLVPCIVTRNGIVVQSFGFKNYLPIGRLDSAVEFFVNWDVDEILILDITATKENRTFPSDVIRHAVKKCFIPITVGGGISTLDDVKIALDNGADKVSINSLALNSPDFLREASRKYGAQCITVSIDAMKVGDEYFVYDYLKSEPTRHKVSDFCIKMEEYEVGEIFLNSVDRDGSAKGYDLNLLRSVASKVRIPVVACGGVGKFSDLAEGILEGRVDAVSAANIFQHTEHSTIAAKSMMKRRGVNVRLCSEVSYDQFSFDHMDRPI